HCGPVAAPIAVGVFEDEHFIVRHLAGFELRINGAPDDPKASARVEANLNRLYYAVFFGGKQIDLETVGDLEGSEFGRGVVGIGCVKRRKSKHQKTKNKKAPISKHKGNACEQPALLFEACCLVLVWSLELGVWCFHFTSTAS